MAKLSVLLVCGSGASTGFMAANMRKAAKEKGLELEIYARSESEIEVYAEDANYILLGPHLGYLEDEVKDRVKELGSSAKVFVMDKSYYSTLDGAAAIADLQAHM
ncbi:MAG: PTS sugar transporter subunit IIB [Deferribacteraceae bacterium]|jgi:PTS system cellobiose-specific IIB component|nr:PTS sugar transporter subunit IIB [Deferribacteraceae bacterium]